MEEVEEPAAVLVAADADDVRRATVELLDGRARVAVSAVEAVDEVADLVGGEDSVDCVVTSSTLADGDWRDLVYAVRERHPDLPVVLYADEPDALIASEATSAGVTEYLPREFDDGEELADRVTAEIERYESVRTAREQSRRYDQAMGNVPFTMFFKDEAGRFTDVSAGLEAVTDVDPIGKTDAEIWGTPDNPTGTESHRDDLRVIETGTSIIDKEERQLIDGGKTIWVEASKFPIEDENGEIEGLFGFSQDVTPRKRREEELRRQRQRLEQFASYVSHDLRNPINIAQGYIERAIETGDEDAMEEVRDALDRMESLIGDLLTTVRDGDETEEWVEFAPFVERVWTGTELEAADLVVEIPEGTTIASVPGQFRQILHNLFRNAAEHGGEGVVVTVGLTDTGFYVEDDGSGIDSDLREEVFEYGHSNDGTGIGLTITRDIASVHGWDVSVEESETGGARFVFDDCLIRRGERQALEPDEPVRICETVDVGDATPQGGLDRGEGRGTFHVEGGGRNVWTDVEEHFYAYGTVDAPARILAKVTDFGGVHEFSKAGVMIRAWPEEGSPLAYVGATAHHGVEAIHRQFPNDRIQTDQFETREGVPRWYRLDWIDNTVSFMTSTDGTSWNRVLREPIAGHDPISPGLAVCSLDPERTCQAVFEDVRAVGLEPADPDE